MEDGIHNELPDRYSCQLARRFGGEFVASDASKVPCRGQNTAEHGNEARPLELAWGSFFWESNTGTCA